MRNARHDEHIQESNTNIEDEVPVWTPWSSRSEGPKFKIPPPADRQPVDEKKGNRITVTISPALARQYPNIPWWKSVNVPWWKLVRTTLPSPSPYPSQSHPHLHPHPQLHPQPNLKPHPYSP